MKNKKNILVLLIMGCFQVFGATEEETQEIRKAPHILHIFHKPGTNYYITAELLSDGRYLVVEHLSSGEIRKSTLTEKRWLEKRTACSQ